MSVTGVAHGQANGVAYNVAIPATAAVGQAAWLVLAASNLTTLVTPTGWTIKETMDVNNLRMTRYLRILQAGDLGSNINFNYAGKTTAVIVTLSEVDPAFQETAATPASLADPLISDTRTNPAATAVENGPALSYMITRGNTPPTSWSPPSGWTLIDGWGNPGTGAVTVAVAYREVVPGSVGGGVWGSNTSEARAITSVILPKYLATPPPPTGPSLKVWNGSAADTVNLLGVWNGSAVDPVNVLGVWNGASVDGIS